MPNSSVAFDRAADYYDQTRGFPPGIEGEIAALIAPVGGFTPSSRVLEIGVGTGRIALPLSAHVSAYYGIDLARPMMDRLRAKQQAEPVYIAQGNATRLPFPRDRFDGVIAVHVFHLIPTWREVLDEVVRVLRPGAPLVHGWNGRLISDRLLHVWREATHEAQATTGAIPHAERNTFLIENGWRAITPVRSAQFMVYRSPQEFVSLMEQRCFSSTWQMSDAQIARGLDAVRAYIDARYADPTEPEPLESSFNVQAYLPPET